MDEFLFVLTLPLWILVPYIAGCFLVALIKLWAIRLHDPGPVQLGLIRNLRIDRRRRP